MTILQHYDWTTRWFPWHVSLETRDLERLYTGLPQADIFQRLTALIVDIWQLHVDQPYLLLSPSGLQVDLAHLPPQANHGAATFFKVGRRSHYLFIQGGSQHMMVLLISQSHFRVGGRVYRQAEGIPMGLIPCVHFANFYLCSYELHFAMDLVHIFSPATHAVRPVWSLLLTRMFSDMLMT